MFGTALNYVTLRLLGEGANDGQGAMEKGRQWILDHGGATAITSWGKMWLSVLYIGSNYFFFLCSYTSETLFNYSLFLMVAGSWRI